MSSGKELPQGAVDELDFVIWSPHPWATCDQDRAVATIRATARRALFFRRSASREVGRRALIPLGLDRPARDELPDRQRELARRRSDLLVDLLDAQPRMRGNVVTKRRRGLLELLGRALGAETEVDAGVAVLAAERGPERLERRSPRDSLSPGTRSCSPRALHLLANPPWSPHLLLCKSRDPMIVPMHWQVVSASSESQTSIARAGSITEPVAVTVVVVESSRTSTARASSIAALREVGDAQSIARASRSRRPDHLPCPGRQPPGQVPSRRP